MTSTVNGICENVVCSTSKSWSLMMVFLPNYRRNVEAFTSRAVLEQHWKVLGPVCHKEGRLAMNCFVLSQIEGDNVYLFQDLL